VLIGGIVLGLVLGLLAGGSIWHLARVRFRWLVALLLAVVIRFGTELAISAGIGVADAFRLPLFTLAYALLLAGLWANRSQPGILVAFVGILSNTIAVVANAGRMPIWEPSLIAAGLTPEDIRSSFHTILTPPIDASFLLHAGPLIDVLPFPVPYLRNVASMGDAFLSLGLGFFLFATVVRPPRELFGDEAETVQRRLTGVAETTRERADALERAGVTGRHRLGLAHGLAEASILERPAVLGGAGVGMAAPGMSPALAQEGIAEESVFQPEQTAADAARHPYVRLALNPAFAALWSGGLISLLGDRIHQIALAFLAYGLTESPIAVGAIFAAAALPNLLFSPIAGALVDRWDHQEVLVVSDLLRAALVLLIPIAAVVNLLLVYPLVFLITTVSIFFRPARVAMVPRLVRDDELLTANSATWISETVADVAGYPLAGLFVGLLGSSFALAFWIDAATYLASAILIWSIVVPPLRRSGRFAEPQVPNLVAEMTAGWRFLRGEATLLANTLLATVGQFTIGILVALTPVYASEVIQRGPFTPESVYAFLEAGIGVGNLVGGFVIGLVGATLARGRLVVSGYVTWGLCIALLGLTGNLGLAIGLTIGSGIANMVFVIPSQTLFQERTPPELMGRVLGFRFGLVFGSMTIAMAVGGVLGQLFGAAAVIAVFGVVTMLAGLAGVFVPAVRDA
jgi:MFS family permease